MGDRPIGVPDLRCFGQKVEPLPGGGASGPLTPRFKDLLAAWLELAVETPHELEGVRSQDTLTAGNGTSDYLCRDLGHRARCPFRPVAPRDTSN